MIKNNTTGEADHDFFGTYGDMWRFAVLAWLMAVLLTLAALSLLPIALLLAPTRVLRWLAK